MLEDLELYLVEKPRFCGDMTEKFKILERLTGADPEGMNRRATGDGTQSKGGKLWQACPIWKVRGKTFRNRVFDAWDKLPSEVVKAEYVNGVNRSKDKTILKKMLLVFGG